MPGRRSDQGFDLTGESAVIDGAIERAAALALYDRGQIGRALAAALAHEHDVDAMATGDVAMNALDALDSARRIRVAQDERGPLHRDAVDEQSERNVDDLVTARAQRRNESLRFRGSVAHEDQGSDFGRAP